MPVKLLKGRNAVAKINRKIILVDEAKCNGCGNCMPSCPEQAFQLVATPKGPKARLVKDFYCDGMGACMGSCPVDALRIIEREADEYDDAATIERLKKVAPEMLETHIKHIQEHSQQCHAEAIGHAHGCPSSREMSWQSQSQTPLQPLAQTQSMLRQWPVQLHLISPSAPYFKNADVTIVADCVPFAYANFHNDFLRDNSIAIACPKLDDTASYVDKLTSLIKTAEPKSITVAHMEVPCCSGLAHIVQTAIKDSGNKVPYKTVIIGVKGEIKQ